MSNQSKSKNILFKIRIRRCEMKGKRGAVPGARAVVILWVAPSGRWTLGCSLARDTPWPVAFGVAC
jgi:hypothetical protein